MADIRQFGPLPSGGDTPDSVSRMSALDLYEDLLIGEDKYDENRVYTMQEILEEKRLLEEQNASLLHQIVESKIEMKKMETEKLALQQHFDSLLATARVELNRKNTLLHQHLNERVKPSHETASKVTRPKITNAAKKKNLPEIYKGRRVPEDELGPANKCVVSEYKSTSEQTASNMTTKNAVVSVPSASEKVSTHREAPSKECRPTPSLVSSERRTTKYSHKENELESTSKIGSKKYRSASRKIVSTKTVKDSTVPISSNPRRNSAPRDTVSRKIVKDLAFPVLSTSVERSSLRDPQSRGDRPTHFSASNEQPTTKYNSTEKTYALTNSSIPPMNHDRNEVDYSSAKSNSTRNNNHSDYNSRPASSGETVDLLKGERSSPRDTVSKKSVKDLAFPMPSTSGERSSPRDPQPRGRHPTRSSASNEQPTTKYNSTEKTYALTNSSIPPTNHDRNEIDYSSAKSNSTRNNNHSDYNRAASSGETVDLLKGESSNKERRKSNYRSAIKRVTRTDPCESESHQPNAPSKSSLFSHSHVAITPHISGSLMQTPHSPSKDHPLLDAKVKETDKKSKSTVTKTDSKKLSVNPGQTSSKYKTRDKYCNKIVSERSKQILGRSVSETDHLRDTSRHNTHRPAIVPLQSKKYPVDMLELPIDTPACPYLDINIPKGSKSPSAADAAPTSHGVKIRKTDSKKSSSRSAVTRKLSVDYLKASSEESNEQHLIKVHKLHGRGQHVHVTTLQNDGQQSVSMPSVEDPTDMSKLPIDNLLCDPLDNTDEISLNKDGAIVASMDTSPGSTVCSTVLEQSTYANTSECVSKTNESDARTRSIHCPELILAKKSASSSLPVSACARDDLKLLVSTSRSGEKPVSFSAAEVPADFQPQVCLVDITSIDPAVKTNSRPNSETTQISQPATVCRKRKLFRQHEKDVNSKRQKQSEMCVTNEHDAAAALSCHPEMPGHEHEAMVNVELKLQSATCEAKVVTKPPEADSLSANTANVSCEVKSKRTCPHSGSNMRHQESVDGAALASQALGRAYITQGESKAIFTSLPKVPTATSSLSAWLASGQIERRNGTENLCPIVVPPIRTHLVDNDLIKSELNSADEEFKTKQTQCNGSTESKIFRNAALRWLLYLAVEELKATKGLSHHPRPLSVSNGAPATRKVWLSSLTKCQERRKQNAKWSS